MATILYIDDDYEVSCATILDINENKITIKDIYDGEGKYINDEPKSITADKILTWRPLKTFVFPVFIRHYSTLNQPKASIFIKNGDRIEGPSNGLGSGIYGIYIKDEEHQQLVDNRARSLSPNVNFYDLQCRDPFIIEDKYHLKSITVAANSTARYINKIITTNEDMNIDDVFHLSNLWNIVFYRHGDWPFTIETFGNVLINYINYIRTDQSLIDMQQNVTHELPMNFVFRYLGYQSLISDDDAVNDFQNGCLILNYRDYRASIESKGANRIFAAPAPIDFISKPYTSTRTRTRPLIGITLD